MENTGMSWAEKFRILRETLNWPATHIIEYIDAGYTVPAFSIYTMIETGKREEPTHYLITALCRSFKINQRWIWTGNGDILQNHSRIRSDTKTISKRAERRPLGKSFARLKSIADEMNVGLEYLICGDEMAKENPCNDKMISFLQQQEEIRKQIWADMGEKENVYYYESIKRNAKDAIDLKGRIDLLRVENELTIFEFDKMTSVGIEHAVRAEIPINKIANVFSVSREWLRSGNIASLAFPCDQKMTIFLREHPEIRKKVMDEMKKN